VGVVTFRSQPARRDIAASEGSNTAERVNVLGVGVSVITMADALARIDQWVAARANQYICVTGVHGVMESQLDPGLRAIHNRAGLVTPDGMPLVWVSRLQGHREVERVYGPDLMLACCEASVAKGYRHFFYGGAPGVPGRLRERLQTRFPGLQVADGWSPPFRELTMAEEQAMIDRINAAQPHIVWVGLSTPKQERWMARYVGRISAPVLIGVGAAFDIHSGTTQQAPRWMQRSGLEWLFRLGTEPRRLWRRYLINNPRFVWHLLLQSARIVHYDVGAEARTGPGPCREPEN
jgi:N-acetylglucosaminyldiphosphoundecaprenol N-acetyl-beta-D-mannosaminyltransferase